MMCSWGVHRKRRQGTFLSAESSNKAFKATHSSKYVKKSCSPSQARWRCIALSCNVFTLSFRSRVFVSTVLSFSLNNAIEMSKRKFLFLVTVFIRMTRQWIYVWSHHGYSESGMTVKKNLGRIKARYLFTFIYIKETDFESEIVYLKQWKLTPFLLVGIWAVSVFNSLNIQFTPNEKLNFVWRFL